MGAIDGWIVALVANVAWIVWCLNCRKESRKVSKLREKGRKMALLLNRRSQGGRISSVLAARAVSEWVDAGGDCVDLNVIIRPAPANVCPTEPVDFADDRGPLP